VRNFLLTIL